jgi:site-specific recombinase XerD
MQLTRVPKELPVVLSPEEVENLIAAALNIRYRTILLLLWATGLRQAEAAGAPRGSIHKTRLAESRPTMQRLSSL